MSIRRQKLCALSIALTLSGSLSFAQAQDWADALATDPPSWQLGRIEASLEGFANAAAYTAMQDAGSLIPGGTDETGITGQLVTLVRLERFYDTGLAIGARGSFLLLRDELSGDNYGNDTIQRLYLYMQTGLGRFEIGQQDGAAYAIGFTGPQVDGQVSLENPDSGFFRDPLTEEAFNSFAQEVTLVNSSSNAAKFNYVSPRLLGVQIGASYTPNLVKAPLPWLGNPSNSANIQASLWEVAGSYTKFFGRTAVGLSAAYARGAQRNPTPGGGDLYDWTLGLEFTTNLDEIRLSWGGALRVSNGYGFTPEMVIHGAETRRVHLSALAERGPWRLGVEFSDTLTDADAREPEIAITAYQLAGGYEINRNLQFTVGWQWYDYKRDVGVFFHGDSMIDMNAGFVAIRYEL